MVGTSEHGQTLRSINSWHGPVADRFFLLMTRSAEHLTYALLALFLLWHRLRYALLFPLAGLLVTLFANGLKAYFKHPRPGLWIQEQRISEQINLVQGMELFQGYTSFPSGHTMSAFTLATLLILLLPRSNWLGLGIALWAILSGISRIYLVQHFLEDVIFGAVLGVIVAWLLYLLQRRLPYDPGRWYDQGLFMGRKMHPV